LLSLAMLAYHAMPKLKWLFRLLHYKLTAETPQLVYKQTPQNEKLLERCATMSTFLALLSFVCGVWLGGVS
jgi:hypothetical protein